MKFIKKFVRDNKAATAIEYGLIAALIAVAGITAMGAVGTGIQNTFNNVKNKLYSERQFGCDRPLRSVAPDLISLLWVTE